MSIHILKVAILRLMYLIPLKYC